MTRKERRAKKLAHRKALAAQIVRKVQGRVERFVSLHDYIHAKRTARATGCTSTIYELPYCQCKTERPEPKGARPALLETQLMRGF